MNSSTGTSDKDSVYIFNVNFHSVFTRSSFLLPPLDEDLKAPSLSLCVINLQDSNVYEIPISLYPNKAMGGNGIGSKVLSQCVLDLYKPLFHRFSLSPSEHEFPMEWQTHSIILTFKSGDKLMVSNYRPISLLSSVSKVMESLIYDKFIDFEENSFSSCKFVLQAKHSALQKLLTMIDQNC